MALLHIEDLELGPATYTLGAAAKLASKSGGSLSTTLSDYSVEGELSGMVHRRRMHLKAEVSFTPDDQISTAIINALYPYRTSASGISAFSTSAATALKIETMDAATFELLDAALVKMPDLNFAVNKGLFGSCTFRARPSYGVAPGAADALIKRSATGGGWVAPTFANAEFIAGTPILTWDTTHINSEADDGWTVTFNTKTQDVMAGGRLRDIRFMGFEMMVRGIPTDNVPQDLIDHAALNTEVVNSGESTRSIAKPLVLTMGTSPSLLTLTIPLAAPVSAGFRFGATTIRNGELGFVSVKNFTGPVIFTLAVS